MALEVYNVTQIVFKPEGPVKTYGWTLTDGSTEVVRTGFKYMRDRTGFIIMMNDAIERFVDSTELKLTQIAALLFKYDGSEFNNMYLESLLFNHEGMDIKKSEAILKVAERATHEIMASQHR